MYYNKKREAWCLADAVRSTAPFAYILGNTDTPDKATGTWMVFNKGAKSRTSLRSKSFRKPSAGSFETEPLLQCVRESVLAAFQPHTERGRQIARLIASQEEFLKELSHLRQYRMELQNVILNDDYPGGVDGVLGTIDQMEEVSEHFYHQISLGVRSDPSLDEPIGAVLSHCAQKMLGPFTAFCTDLTDKMECILKHEFHSSSGVPTDRVSVQRAMEAPFLQLQR